MTLRWLTLTCVAAFAITLALLLGQKLSNETWAMLVGIIIGMIASWPGYVVLFRLANPPHPHPSLPSNPIPQPLPPRAETPLPPASLPRRFVVIGGEDLESSRE